MTYSSSLAMSRQRYSAGQQNTTRFKRNDKSLGPISNSIMLIILACLLGLLYLTQVTKTNSLSYKINALKNRQAQLKSEHDDLVVGSARLQALERIKNSDTAKNLVSLSSSSTVQN